MRNSICIVVLLALGINVLKAQMPGGVPYSFFPNLFPRAITPYSSVVSTTLPAFDNDSIIYEDSVRSHRAWLQNGDLGGHYSAIGVEVEIPGLNEWTIDYLSNGAVIYRYKVISPSSKEISVFFDPFILGEDAELFIYNTSDTSDTTFDIIGSYSDFHNKNSGVMRLPSVKGNEIIIELYEPAEEVGNSQLNIQKIYHHYSGGDIGDEVLSTCYSGKPCHSLLEKCLV